MKLTQQHVTNLIQHLSQSAPNGIKCPVCGNTHWLINDTIFQCTEFTGATMAIGGGISLVPLVMITCGQCQHTLQFNAMKLGLLSDTDDAKSHNNDQKDESK